jgi:hypothetical protein
MHSFWHVDFNIASVCWVISMFWVSWKWTKLVANVANQKIVKVIAIAILYLLMDFIIPALVIFLFWDTKGMWYLVMKLVSIFVLAWGLWIGALTLKIFFALKKIREDEIMKQKIKDAMK